MSAPGKQKITQAAERPKYGPGRGMGGPHGGRVAEKAINFGPSLKRLLTHLTPERGTIAVAVALTATSVFLNVIGPKVLGRVMDLVFAGVVGKLLPPGVSKTQVIAGLRRQGQDRLADMVSKMDLVPGQGIEFDKVGEVVLLVLAIYASAAFLMWLQGYLLNGALQRSIYRMRRDVAAKLDRLPLSYFDKQPRGELLSRVTNDIDNVSQSLQQSLSQLLSSLLTLLGVLVMMLITSPTLTLIALVSIPFSVGAAMVIGKRSQKRFAAVWKSTGELNAHIEEAYTGHALVKVFGRQREVEQVFAERNGKLFGSAFGAQFISSLIMPTMFFIGNLSFVAICVVGGLRVAHGQLSIGDVQAFIQYNRMFTQPLTQVASMTNLLQSGVASAERVFQVLDEEEQSPEATGTLSQMRGAVEFRNVSFSYTAEPLIQDLNLVVNSGQTVAIVGPTGAGKTTLVNLLMRFYEVQGGAILLDGTDITSVPRHALRNEIGMVLQDTWLFHGTIRENIAYGRPGATEAEIMAAAQACFVDRFVHSLSDGYDTVIDEEAGNISAGEKQLITIARAFLSDPGLLILDEATSSVDTRTEALVQHAMAALRSGRTSFVIAHRLSTIRDADVILVMEHGKIVEKGSHEELLAARGSYYALYQSQFNAATEAT